LNVIQPFKISCTYTIFEPLHPLFGANKKVGHMRKENSTNNQNRKQLHEFCGMVYAHDLINGRWKMLILYKLGKGSMRYTNLKKLLPNITERMLTLQLKALEKDYLISRTVYAEMPIRVEYQLTESGRVLSPIWLAMEKWGDAHRSEFNLDKANPTPLG
jgi:DNA-binding HxlR family transcriptional regulator